MVEMIYYDHRRFRHGTTSPPLVGIETNPGPKRKASRKTAKEPPKQRRKWTRLTETEKGKIEYGYECGHSASEIARRLNRKDTTVLNAIKKLDEHGKIETKTSPGRPVKLNSHERDFILNLSETNRRLTARDLADRLLTEAKERKIGESSIRKLLCRNGLYGRIARRKPLLLQRHKDKRIEFAQNHLGWSTNQWAHVLFSDESPFSLFPARSRSYIRRRPGEELKEGLVDSTVKSPKIQVWSAFHRNGVGPLIRIKGKMDQHVYHKILINHAMSTLTGLAKTTKKEAKESGVEPVTWTFQHDNDPKHTAKKNVKYLRNKVESSQKDGLVIDVLPWPSQSPDLNPIENLWSYIKRQLRKKAEKPTNLDELFDQVKEEWEALPKNYLAKLADSMPRRLQAVINAKGFAIPY